MYGAPVTEPMEIPQEPPSYFAQVPAPLPEMKDATVGTLRLEGTLAKRLPPMPSGELQNLSFTNNKQLEAAQLMNDMRAAYSISRQQASRSRQIAKMKNTAAGKEAERLGKQAVAKGKNLTARNIAKGRAARFRAMQ